MNLKRRSVLQLTALAGLMLGAGLITPAQAAQWNQVAFQAKTLEDVYKALGDGVPEASLAIKLSAPDVAENGALVPISVQTPLLATELAILVQNNPSPLAAWFMLPEGTEPFIATRVKMSQSSMVYALAKVAGRWHMASKEVVVTLGGCGV